MKNFVFAAVSALALAGCGAIGGGEKTAMVKACTESGESEKNCTCIADSLETNLDAPTFKLVAKAMAAGEAEGEKMMEELPAEQQGKVMGALMSAGMGCMMGAASEG
ncbi:MAG: hypothetical protein RLO80_08630 [Hyphomonas sp.]